MRVGAFGSLEFVGEKEGKPGDLPAFRPSWPGMCVTKDATQTPAIIPDRVPPRPSADGPDHPSPGTSGHPPGAPDIPPLEPPAIAPAKLPAPASPFGLSLASTDVTDEGLKELAGLKSLQALDLSYTRVTDAGLKELAGLKNLHALNLSGTRGIRLPPARLHGR